MVVRKFDREFYNKVLRAIRCTQRDVAEAEEVLQATLVKLYGSTSALKLTGFPISYLVTCARRMRCSLYRARDRKKRGGGLVHHPFDDAQVPTRGERDAIDHVQLRALLGQVSQLPRLAGAVLQSHALDGLSLSEVADRMSITRRDASRHLERARRILRRRFQRELE